MRKAGLVLGAVCITCATTVNLVGYAKWQNVVPIVREDCIKYDPDSLEITDEGDRGRLLTDDGGRHRMLGLANREDAEAADAEAALALAKRHKAMCFIGRNNRRPNRRDYIVRYWK